MERHEHLISTYTIPTGMGCGLMIMALVSPVCEKHGVRHVGVRNDVISTKQSGEMIIETVQLADIF